jgi:hypothetical protein
VLQIVQPDRQHPDAVACSWRHGLRPQAAEPLRVTVLSRVPNTSASSRAQAQRQAAASPLVVTQHRDGARVQVHDPRPVGLGRAIGHGVPLLWSARTRYPCPAPVARADTRSILVPLQLRVRDDILAFLSTTTVLGTPRDVTLSELAIESFYPADARTAAVLRAVA